MENDNLGEAVITNCYSIGDIMNSSAGGIVGRNCGLGTEKVLIGNCYSFGDITNSGGGIMGADANGDNIRIENCFSKHAINTSNTHIGAEHLVASKTGGSTSNFIFYSAVGGGSWNSATVDSALKDNYTDSFGVSTDTDVWIKSGDFATGYGLTVFTRSPWNGYTLNSSIPTLTNGCNSYSDRTGAVNLGLYFKKNKRKKE